MGRTSPEDVARDKQAVRERIWSRLEREGASRFPGTRGRIPNFRSAETAAERLAALATWRAAGVVKANPDAPQLPVRARALEDGKRVLMAVPRLRAQHPFVLLDPRHLDVSSRRAASIRGASEAGRPAALDDVRRVDLVVCGSVAVDRRGARVGKGGGYADIEFALLVENGAIDDRTTVVTSVHESQVVDQHLPETEHDFRVDVIVTPERAIRCRRRRRRRGILWDHLDEQRIAAIPVLAELRRG